MVGGRVADQIGRVFGGRYRLVAPIGTGGSAHVYVADDTSLRRRVAVKVLQPGLALDQAFLRRFRAEAQAAAALNHPNIMRVFDWGEDDGGPFLVLEFLEGGSLRDMLDSGRRLSNSQAVLVGLEAARALDYAHRRGLVHRDMKPANICFDEEGRTAIADFGLARALAEAAWTEPEGVLLGTARYAAPEAAQGRSVDGKADVYGLGLVLLEAVTGDPPPAGDTTVATLMARANQPIVAPFGLGALGTVIDAAGAVDPDDRPDAAELAVMLDTAARQLDAPEPLPVTTVLNLAARTPAAADPTQLGATSAVPTVAGQPVAGPPAADAPGRQTRRRVSIVIGALVAIAALVAGALYIPTILKPEHAVPNVEGQPIAQARIALAAFKFKVDERGDYSRTTAKDHVIRQSPDPNSSLREDSTVRVWVSRGQPIADVPDLTGKTEDEAKALLAEKMFQFDPNVEKRNDETVEKGRVLDWNPKGRAAEQTPVHLIVSDGPPPRTIGDWFDRLFQEAKAGLEGQGLNVKRVDGYSDTIAVGKVISTLPGKGQTATKGSTVTVTVCAGALTVTVPQVNGMTVEDAGKAILAAGLHVGSVFGPSGKNRRVFTSTPEQGAKVQRGSHVSLYTR